ncbi:MAG: hypothetical protein ACHQX3_06325, partial [Nitrospirales bacterium]
LGAIMQGINNHMDENDLQEVDRAAALQTEAAKEVDERAQYTMGLRLLADFYDQNPGVPIPWLNHANYAVDTKEHAEAVARGLGTFKKDGNDNYLHLTKTFGNIVAKFVFTRENVCVKRVVGVETIPAYFVEAHTVEARTKEIVEWDCQPLLVPKEK